MTRAIKIWFCLAVAVIAAAIADPLIEGASNAGWFGAGNFTDHSNWDIIPALVVGMFFVCIHLVLRTRVALRQRQTPVNWLALTTSALGPSVVRLVPVILVVQIAALYLMETLEQLVVYGHVLGGSLWLGGPIAVSLAAHAVFCVVVALASAHILRALARATVRIVRFVSALVRLIAFDESLSFVRYARLMPSARRLGVACSVGQRAPPNFAFYERTLIWRNTRCGLAVYRKTQKLPSLFAVYLFSLPAYIYSLRSLGVNMQAELQRA